MAVLERTISKSGSPDYSTIAAWEAAAPSLGTDIWKGVIQDAVEYNESVTFDAAGTPSSTSYLWLTALEASRHSGVAGTGHARIRGTSGHVFTINDAFSRIEWLEVELDTAGSSDECFRIAAGADNTLVSHCIVYTGNAVADQDGFYVGNWDISNLTIDNCVIYGFFRAGIDIQQFRDGEGGYTQSVNIDHCTVYDCGDSTEVGQGGIVVWSNDAADVITINVYNTIAVGGDVEAWANFGGIGATRGQADGTVTWNGSHNLKDYSGTGDLAGSTNNLTNWQEATNGITDVTQSSGSWLVVTDLTVGSEDLTLLDDAAGNLAVDNGTDRQGSEPDSRQDFSLDVEGDTRPTTGVDIGADEFETVSAGATFPEAPLNLSATVISESQIDLAWDAVTNAQYYDVERDGVIVSKNQVGVTFSDTGLDSGTEYSYRVRALRDG